MSNKTCISSPNSWTQGQFEKYLSAMLIDKNSQLDSDLQKVRQFIYGLDISCHLIDRFEQWAINYIGI